jgi:hypothetical protein
MFSTATCHPNRPAKSKGLCKQCYHRHYYLDHRPADVITRRPGENYGRIPTCHPDRPHAAAGLCVECYHKLPNQAAYRKEWQRTNGRRTLLKHRYGITIEQYETQNKEQNSLCAICGQPPRGKTKRLFVDHNHTTDKTRGLLCITCNRAIGYLENLDWLTKAQTYLLFWRLKHEKAE